MSEITAVTESVALLANSGSEVVSKVVNATISNATEVIANVTQMVSNTTLTNVTEVVANATVEVVNKTGMFGGMFTGEVTGASLAVIGAGIAVGAAGIASAVGAGIVGSAGARNVAENPKNFSTSLLFQALPQTQGIYGFLIAILILLGTGIIGAVKDVSVAQGLGALGAGLAVGLSAVSAIGQGIAASSGLASSAADKKMFGKSVLFSVLPETQALYGFIISILILIGMGIFGAAKGSLDIVTGWASVGAGLAVGIAGISAIGQGIAAAGGIGAVLEKSKTFGKSILFSVLPETQALYGFIVAVLILIGFGILGVPKTGLSLGIGMFAVGAGLAAGLSAVSAVGQGIAASSGINATTQNEKSFGKNILFSVLPETQALYGFLIAILLLVGGGLIGIAKEGISTAVGTLAIGAGLAVGLAAISAIGQGLAAASGISASSRDDKAFGKSILFSVLPETQALYGFLIAILLLVGGGIIGAVKVGITSAVGIIGLGAGVAVGIAGVSAIGQGIAASSGIGTTAQDEKLFGKSILFSVLPETQALYGFLIGILLLVGGGILGATKTGFSAAAGMVALGSGLAVGVAALSAIGQGIVASGGIAASLQDKKMFGKSILFSVLPETQALYGFLISILLLVGGGIMGAAKSGMDLSVGLIAIGAGIAAGVAAVSAIGQGISAAAGIASVTEKKEVFGKSIIFSIIPETQALMGFLIAILLLTGAGLIGGIKSGLTIPMGIIAIASGLAIGLAAVSAVGQSSVITSGIAAVTRDAKMFGKALLFGVLPQTQALYGFLIAILLLLGGGIIGAVKEGLNSAAGVVAIGSGLAVGLAAISAIGQGFASANGVSVVQQDKKMFGKALLFGVLPQTQALYGFLISILLLVGGGIVGSVKPGLSMSVGLIAVGAGLAVGLGSVSAVGQGLVAGASVGVAHQDKRLFGKSILFSVLPETQALYGFLIAILLLVGGGLVGALKTGLTIPVGLVAIGAGLAIGVAAISAIGQGIAASSGVGSVAEKDKMFGKGILFSVLPETQALYGLVIAVLMMTGVGLMGAVKTGVTFLQGISAVGIGLGIGFAAISAVGQGIVSAASIGSSLQKAKAMGKALVLSVIPETYAIFGLLISILALLALKFI